MSDNTLMTPALIAERLTPLLGDNAVMPMLGTASFAWNYDSSHVGHLRLYQQGKARQWDNDDDLDWQHPVDPDDPLGLPDQFISIGTSDLWRRLDDAQRRLIRLHSSAWIYSQFLHSEQFALIGVGKIGAASTTLEAKMFAATQLMDEARHVEGFNRYLGEKIGIRYELSPTLYTLFRDAMADPRWDIGVLAAHILVENMGLATFGTHRERLTDPLARSFSAYVARDEARHVAFGRLLLRDLYPELSADELADREDFVLEGCWALRDRYVDDHMWENLDLGKEFITEARRSPAKREFRRLIFMRIVPALRDIGLFGPRVQEGLKKMGVLGFQDIDDEALLALDEEVAAEMAERETTERRRELRDIVQLGAGSQ